MTSSTNILMASLGPKMNKCDQKIVFFVTFSQLDPCYLIILFSITLFLYMLISNDVIHRF